MRDETAELAMALDESQQAQLLAERTAVSLQQRVNKLLIERDNLKERVLQLEVANVDMDARLQDYRQKTTTPPASVDRG